MAKKNICEGDNSKVRGRKISIFTGRNEVLAKVIFLHLSVILFTGGGGGVLLARPPPDGEPPLSRHPPDGDPPQSRHTPPDGEHPPPTTGRYASYWNAFLS